MTLNFQDRLKSVAVIGAAGKMGNGIAWVLLQALAIQDAKEHGCPGSGQYSLIAIDNHAEGLVRLRAYLRAQTIKFAERRISELREWSKERLDLVENGEIISAFVEGALSMVKMDSDLQAAKPCKLVFEAVFEDLGVKTGLYWKLKGICSADTYFFSNTSSIPISAMDHGADLHGRILGFHFYNPPAVQKLVEVIAHKETLPELITLGTTLGKTLEKVLVVSQDVAGFIGNGHFIREGLFALKKFLELRKVLGDPEALLTINRVTSEFLLRPMGMFQLMDFVGLDVFEMILGVMRRYIQDDSFENSVLSSLITLGIRGGQSDSGIQKNGFFKYDKNKIIAVFDPIKKDYKLLSELKLRECDTWLGILPNPTITWHTLSKSSDLKSKLQSHFNALSQAHTAGAALTFEFLKNSASIAQGLVEQGVASSKEDVTAIVCHGFHHLYSPFEFGN